MNLRRWSSLMRSDSERPSILHTRSSVPHPRRSFLQLASDAEFQGPDTSPLFLAAISDGSLELYPGAAAPPHHPQSLLLYLAPLPLYHTPHLLVVFSPSLKRRSMYCLDRIASFTSRTRATPRRIVFSVSQASLVVAFRASVEAPPRVIASSANPSSIRTAVPDLMASQLTPF